VPVSTFRFNTWLPPGTKAAVAGDFTMLDRSELVLKALLRMELKYGSCITTCNEQLHFLFLHLY